MHLHSEALADPPGQFGRLELGFPAQRLLQILSDLGSQFVRAFGAAFVREEAFQARVLKSLPCLVDRASPRRGKPCRTGLGSTWV